MRSTMTGLNGDPAAAPFGPMGASGLGKFALLEIAVLILMVVLMTAVQRAILHPERSAFAYLRLGMDELRMFALAVILLILFYILMILGMLVLALVAGLIGMAAGMGAAGPMAAILMVGLLAFVLVFEVRFALAFPLTLLRGKIIIGEAWRITRGRFWTLFAAFLLLTVIILAVIVAASLVTTGSFFAELIRDRFDPAGAAAAQRAMMERQFGPVTAMTVLGWILNGLAGTFALVLFGGAVATAARELTGNIDAIAETFA
ncbi:MAG: hypothetical protein ACJ8EB_14010 [Allosphingosinicella sp.]